VHGDTNAGRVVQVDDGGFQARPLEQLQLGRFVAVHVAVVVEVVARQVGEHGDVEMHAGRAVFHQADRRHLDRQRFGAGRRAAWPVPSPAARRPAWCSRWRRIPARAAREQADAQRADDGRSASPSRASACAVHSAHEVLPLVPVTPTVNMAASGWP
jgi:hypothetical protein